MIGLMKYKHKSNFLIAYQKVIGDSLHSSVSWVVNKKKCNDKNIIIGPKCFK